MPGKWSEASRPSRPGAYFNFEAIPEVRIPPTIGSVVAIPFTHDWGPDNVAVALNSFGEYEDVFGDNWSPGRLAVLQAFKGEDLEGVMGAGQVVAYRMAAPAGAVATRSLTNTTPVAALRIDAVYKGTRGNTLTVTVQDKAADATKTELIVYDGTVELERFDFLDADLADAAAQINLVSDWVRATVLQDGVALTPVANGPLTGGLDGTPVTATEWTATMTALEAQRFGFFVPFDLTDAAIITSIETWALNLNDKGKRFETVVGGALNELIATAVTRSASLNDGHFVNLGVGSVQDDLVTDPATGEGVILSMSKLAPRLAGVLANRGEAMAATFARFRGLRLLVGPSEADILKALDGGVVVLSQDSDLDAPVHIEKSLTTYTVKTNTDVPYKVYSRPKFMRTMQSFEVEFTEWAARRAIGRFVVNNKTRDGLVGEAQRRLRAREEAEIIQTGWTVAIGPNPSDDDEFVDVVIGLRFGRSLEQVFFKVRVG